MTKSPNFLTRAAALLSRKTLLGGLDILFSGDLRFFVTRLNDILFRTPPDVHAILARSPTINILTPQHTFFIACMLRQHLAEAGLQSQILFAIDPSTADTSLHIVICANVFKNLPRFMISFQMEQSTSNRWFSARYVNVLRSRSIAVIDYSQRNIAFLTQQCLITYEKLFYVPIGYASNFGSDWSPNSLQQRLDPEFDLVFYGDVNPRRRRILDRLAQQYRILIVSELFGTELYAQLIRAKAVLNIHYYDPSLLETTRIFESLSLGLKVVSEHATNVEEYQHALQDLVKFIDFSDPDAAVDDLRGFLATLSDDRQPTDAATKALVESSDTSNYYLIRMLVGIGALDHSRLPTRDFDAPAPAGDFEMVCLSLPETTTRRAAAWRPPGRTLSVFDGVRHPIPWVGCALSYQHMAASALNRAVRFLVVYEDDVDPVRMDAKTLDRIETYLSKDAGEWDVFCGLITDLNDGATVQRVVVEDGIEYIYLDSMIGMVFNIYANSALKAIADWHYVDAETTPTIDRFIESNTRLRVVTTLPFIAGHREDMISTLWGFRNTSYRDLILASEQRLAKKVSEFLDGRREATSAGQGT